MNFQIWSIVCSFIGGGLFVYIIDEIRKRGKVELNELSVIFNYRTFHKQVIFVSIQLDLHFINTSGHKEVIKDIRVRLFDGTNFVPVSLKDHNTRPSAFIDSKSIKCLQFLLVTEERGVNIDLSSFEKGKGYLEVFYNLKNTIYTCIEMGSKWKIVNITKGYSGANY